MTALVIVWCSLMAARIVIFIWTGFWLNHRHYRRYRQVFRIWREDFYSWRDEFNVMRQEFRTWHARDEIRNQHELAREQLTKLWQEYKSELS
jgi:hypothetical protein